MSENPLVLTEEIINGHVQKLRIDKAINDRFNHIVLKIDFIYKEIFKIDASYNFIYYCDFIAGDKICFRITEPVSKKYSITAPFPISCFWDDADLHINLEMMKSDFVEERTKLKKSLEKIAEEIPETFWQKLVRWFSW